MICSFTRLSECGNDELKTPCVRPHVASIVAIAQHQLQFRLFDSLSSGNLVYNPKVTAMAKEMPVLDAACMINGDSRQRAEFGAKFLEAMTEYGFVKLVRQLRMHMKQ